MAKRRLHVKDIDQLLALYRAERRRLTFQLDQVRNTIAGLKQDKESAPAAPAKAVEVNGLPKRGPGRPRKDPNAAAPARKPGRPKKKERKERALNDWDNVVLGAIQSTGRLLPKEEIMEYASAWARTNESALKPDEVEAFITRSLQKLSSRKKFLGTHHSGLRRGYHYGLKDWFFQSSGKLRRQHYDRLVLEPGEEVLA